MIRRLLLFVLLPSLAWGGDAYFVAVGGNNASAGTSWATAWATPKHADSTINFGDTVIIGSGSFYDVYFRPPDSGSNSARTVYADSTWYEYALGNITEAQWVANLRNGSGKWKSRLYGGQLVTGWTFHALATSGDSIWRAAFVDNDDNSSGWGQAGRVVVSQGGNWDDADSQLVWQTGVLATVLNRPGECYYNNTTDTLFVCLYGGVNPSTKTILATCMPMFYFRPGSTSTRIAHIKIMGLQIKMGTPGVVAKHPHCGGSGGDTDSLFTERCHVAMAIQHVQENPGCFYGVQCSPTLNDWNVIKACSLGGFVFTEEAGNARNGLTPPASGVQYGGSGGGTVVTYSEANHTIDSCYMYGWFANGVHYKNDEKGTPTTEPQHVNNDIKFTTIKPSGAAAGVHYLFSPSRCSVYGNIFIATNRSLDIEGIGLTPIDTPTWDRGFYVCNNTFYTVGPSALVASYMPTVDTSVMRISKFKYNVIDLPLTMDNGSKFFEYYAGYGMTSWEEHYWEVDSNLFYDSPTQQVNMRTSYGVTFDTVQSKDSLGWHTATTFSVAIGLNNPANGDFSRPAASNEMNQTYGGRTWTIFGAVQEAQAAVGTTLTIRGTNLRGVILR